MVYRNYRGKKLQKLSTGGVIGDTLSTAGQGAMAGATFGPEGALIGAGIGAVTGLAEGLIGNSAEKKAEEARQRADYIKNTQLQSNYDMGRLTQYPTEGYNNVSLYRKGGIMIKPSKRGTFKAQASKMGMSTRGAASYILAHKSKYSPEMIKKAVFAHNFAKADGGMIAAPLGSIPDVNTNGTEHIVGDGVQVNTNKKGTDKIKANVDGIPAKLDNREIVVQYNGNPVVISDDNGEAAKYRAMVKAGYDPQHTAKLFAERAMMLNPESGQAKAGGGPLDNSSYYFPNSPYYNPNYIGSTNNVQFPNSVSVDNSNYIPSDYPKIGQSPTYFNSTGSPATTSTSPTTKTTIPKTTINTIPTANIAKSTIDTSLVTPSILPMDNTMKTMGDSSNSNNSIPVSAIAEGAGFLGNVISNISAMNKLSKVKYPTASYNRYIPMNIDVNRPIYNAERRQLLSTDANANKNILENTSNSNVALARLGAVKANEIGRMGNISAREAADRARINNANVMGMNRVGEINTNIANQNALGQYGSQIGKIQTGLALTGSTLSSLQGIIDNMRKDKYQNQYLQAIAQSTGLNVNDPNFSLNSISDAEKRNLAKALKPYLQ